MDTSRISGQPWLNGRGRWLAAAVAVVVVAGIVWITTWPPAMDAGSSDKRQAETAKRADGASSAAVVVGKPFSNLVETSSDPRAARIHIGAVEGVLAPNARGEFPQLPVEASASVEVLVSFPDAKPGDRIGVQSEDGGALAGDAAQGFATLDENRQVGIRYQAGANDGLYRVTLRRGGESRVLKFWVGPEPPILARQ